MRLPIGTYNVQSTQSYEDLVGSRKFLGQLVSSAYRVRIGQDSVLISLDSVFGVVESTPPRAVERTADRLDEFVDARVTLSSGVVRIVVHLTSPQLAEAVVKRVLQQVLAFNTTTSRSKARWERQFIETRLASAGAELSTAEDSLGRFLRSNRECALSPQLQFQADHPKRAMALRQDLAVTLARSLEQAKIDEVQVSRCSPLSSLPVSTRFRTGISFP